MKPITAIITALGLVGATMVAPSAAAAIDGISKLAGFSSDLSAAAAKKRYNARYKTNFPMKG